LGTLIEIADINNQLVNLSLYELFIFWHSFMQSLKVTECGCDATL